MALSSAFERPSRTTLGKRSLTPRDALEGSYVAFIALDFNSQEHTSNRSKVYPADLLQVRRGGGGALMRTIVPVWTSSASTIAVGASSNLTSKSSTCLMTRLWQQNLLVTSSDNM